MAALQSENSVDSWQGIAARWKVITLAALAALVMVLILAVVLVAAESAAKMGILQELKAERDAREEAVEARGKALRAAEFAEESLIDAEFRGWLKGIQEAELEKAQ